MLVVISPFEAFIRSPNTVSLILSSVTPLAGSMPALSTSIWNVTLPPGSFTVAGYAVFFTSSLAGGTGTSTWKSPSQRHFDGDPGNASVGEPHISLTPDWRQLVQLGKFRKPSPSGSLHTAVMVIPALSGLSPLVMSPQESPVVG